MDYKDYCDQCKGNYFALHDEENIKQPSQNSWSCSGTVGPYRWFSAGVYYDKSAHQIDTYKRQHNSNNCSIIRNPSAMMDMINNSAEFSQLVRNPYVVNTEAGYMGATNGLDKLTAGFNGMLKRFFGQEGADVFYNIHEDGNMSVNVNVIKGKDLIMFYPFGEVNSLEGFKRVADSLMASGYPNCIVGLFLTKIAPSTNGTYPILTNMNDLLAW